MICDFLFLGLIVENCKKISSEMEIFRMDKNVIVISSFFFYFNKTLLIIRYIQFFFFFGSNDSRGISKSYCK